MYGAGCRDERRRSAEVHGLLLEQQGGRGEDAQLRQWQAMRQILHRERQGLPQVAKRTSRPCARSKSSGRPVLARSKSCRRSRMGLGIDIWVLRLLEPGGARRRAQNPPQTPIGTYL